MRPVSLPLLLAVLFVTQFISAQTPNPNDAQLALWRGLKKALQGEDGDTFFESALKNALLPGGVDGLRGLKGTVLTSRPMEHPSEVVIAISDANTPDVTLKFLDEQGKEDHLKGAIAPGTRVAFAGIVTGYTKDPFTLTLETRISSATDAGIALVVASLEESAPMPVLSVNYPSKLASRSANFRLDRLPHHKFTLNDHGIATEMVGVLLERLLVTAGWYGDPANKRPHYAVQVDGVESSFTLSHFERGNFDRRAWIVVAGKYDSKPEASLVVVQADGTLIQKVDTIRRIRVYEEQ